MPKNAKTLCVSTTKEIFTWLEIQAHEAGFLSTPQYVSQILRLIHRGEIGISISLIKPEQSQS